MKILTIRQNKDLGLDPEKIYNQIIGGFRKMEKKHMLTADKWIEYIRLEEEDG